MKKIRTPLEGAGAALSARSTTASDTMPQMPPEGVLSGFSATAEQFIAATGTRSILYGDWTRDGSSFAEAFQASYGEADMEGRFPNAWRAGTVAFYYLNNLTSAGKQAFEQTFATHPAYIGALDLTYTSLMKAMISTMLIRAFIQHRNIVIDTHEDGLGPLHNEGYLPWNFKKFGLSVKSVESSLYQMFLSYKIERPELDDEEDVAMSLNALTPNPVHIDDCALDLDERKLGYLRQAHGSALTHAGLAELAADELAKKIKAQFRGGYIYSMGRSRADDTLKFNVVVEDHGQSRVQCGLKYFPAERRVCRILCKRTIHRRREPACPQTQ